MDPVNPELKSYLPIYRLLVNIFCQQRIDGRYIDVVEVVPDNQQISFVPAQNSMFRNTQDRLLIAIGNNKYYPEETRDTLAHQLRSTQGIPVHRKEYRLFQYFSNLF